MLYFKRGYFTIKSQYKLCFMFTHSVANLVIFGVVLALFLDDYIAEKQIETINLQLICKYFLFFKLPISFLYRLQVVPQTFLQHYRGNLNFFVEIINILRLITDFLARHCRVKVYLFRTVVVPSQTYTFSDSSEHIFGIFRAFKHLLGVYQLFSRKMALLSASTY